MRALILNNVALRLIFNTGLLALGLSVFAGLNHVYPMTTTLAENGISMVLVQQVLLLISLGLFAAARVAARSEGRKVRSMLYLLLEFWEFRPGRQSPLSFRLLEWAHLTLILMMFLRALFL